MDVAEIMALSRQGGPAEIRQKTHPICLRPAMLMIRDSPILALPHQPTIHLPTVLQIRQAMMCSQTEVGDFEESF